MLECTLQSVSAGFVADNQRDFDSWEPVAFDGVDEGLQISA